MFKTSHWAKLKRVLSAEGVAITTPLFHTTRINNAEKILAGGFKARAGGPGNDAYDDNAVCFTRNFDFSKSGLFGKITFVLDERDLQKRFKTYTYDWVYLSERDIEDPIGIDLPPVAQKDPYFFEYETRVSRTPGKHTLRKDLPLAHAPSDEFCLIETVISPRYIKAIIIPADALDDKAYADFVNNIAGNIPVIYNTKKDYYSNSKFDEATIFTNVAKEFSRTEARDKAAHSKNKHILAVLALSPDDVVREYVADNKSTAPETLMLLTKDPETLVRRQLATNPSLPVEAALVLANDTETRVTLVLAYNTHHVKVLERLMRHTKAEVRENLAANPDITLPILRYLARDTSPKVRSKVEYRAVNARSSKKMSMSEADEILAILAEYAEVPV